MARIISDLELDQIAEIGNYMARILPPYGDEHVVAGNGVDDFERLKTQLAVKNTRVFLRILVPEGVGWKLSSLDDIEYLEERFIYYYGEVDESVYKL